MKKIEMKLTNLPFNQIKEGSKLIEVRLNDEKRKALEVGDVIIFHNLSTNELLEKEVTSLQIYSSFKELYNAYDSILLGARGYSLLEYEQSMYEYYSKEQEKEYGILAIHLRPIDEDLRETFVSREIPFEGKLLKLRKDKILLPNKKEACREWIEHPGACAIVYVDEEENILLEKQFRYPFGKTFIEIPAGKLDSKLENPINCAIRELQEETGFISKDMQYLGQTALSIAYTNEVIYIYYTKKCEIGKTNFDEDEVLNMFKIPFDEALEMCNNGTITDSKTIVAINLYNNIIRKNNK